MDDELKTDNFFRITDYATDIFQGSLIVLFLGSTGAICLAMLMVQVDVVSTHQL